MIKLKYYVNTVRPNAVYILEPVERAANRTAAQIELALRQVRADRAKYLRNIDRTVVITGRSIADESNGEVNSDQVYSYIISTYVNTFRYILTKSNF